MLKYYILKIYINKKLIIMNVIHFKIWSLNFNLQLSFLLRKGCPNFNILFFSLFWSLKLLSIKPSLNILKQNSNPVKFMFFWLLLLFNWLLFNFLLFIFSLWL